MKTLALVLMVLLIAPSVGADEIQIHRVPIYYDDRAEDPSDGTDEKIDYKKYATCSSDSEENPSTWTYGAYHVKNPLYLFKYTDYNVCINGDNVYYRSKVCVNEELCPKDRPCCEFYPDDKDCEECGAEVNYDGYFTGKSLVVKSIVPGNFTCSGASFCPESKSQSYIEKCEEWLLKAEKENGCSIYSCPSQLATAYCTRANTELLREIKEQWTK